MDDKLVKDIDVIIESIIDTIDDKVGWEISGNIVDTELKDMVYREVVRGKLQRIFDEHVSEEFFMQLYLLFGLYGEKVLGILYAEMKDEILGAEW